MSRHAPEGFAARLDGDGVFIRFFTHEDAAALLDLKLRNREFFAPYEPDAPESEFTLAGVRARIEAHVRDRADDRSYAFGIFSRTDDALVGHITLSAVFRRAWQNANMGYAVTEEENGRGYATQAVRLALAFAFEHAGLHRVQAAVMTDNARSARVLEKAGFRREGLARNYLKIAGGWRDHDIWAVTREDFGDR